MRQKWWRPLTKPLTAFRAIDEQGERILLRTRQSRSWLGWGAVFILALIGLLLCGFLADIFIQSVLEHDHLRLEGPRSTQIVALLLGTASSLALMETALVFMGGASAREIDFKAERVHLQEETIPFDAIEEVLLSTWSRMVRDRQSMRKRERHYWRLSVQVDGEEVHLIEGTNRHVVWDAATRLAAAAGVGLKDGTLEGEPTWRPDEMQKSYAECLAENVAEEYTEVDRDPPEGISVEEQGDGEVSLSWKTSSWEAPGAGLLGLVLLGFSIGLLGIFGEAGPVLMGTLWLTTFGSAILLFWYAARLARQHGPHELQLKPAGLSCKIGDRRSDDWRVGLHELRTIWLDLPNFHSPDAVRFVGEEQVYLVRTPDEESARWLKRRVEAHLVEQMEGGEEGHSF